MDFGEVIRGLKENPDRKYTREGWNGKGQWISLWVPESGFNTILGSESDMTQPYIYIHTNYGANVPWFASQTDMLAEDWMEFQFHNEERRVLNDGTLVKIVIQKWDSNDRGYDFW